jgi:predicted nicotinamide N-methyase
MDGPYSKYTFTISLTFLSILTPHRPTKMGKKKAQINKITIRKNNSENNDNDSNNNKPRNHLITDATKPFHFDYTKFGAKERLTVHQTPSEDTWPGGALWDLGVILAKLLVSWTRGATYFKATPLPCSFSGFGVKGSIVLELGCGVGLTGLVAASLGAKATILTDLQAVIEQVTQKNVEENAQPGPSKTCGYRKTRAGGKVVAMPLSWGDTYDEEATQQKLQELVKLKNGKGTTTRTIYPDWILIGDVAYQHKPGAPSHFDILLSTLLKFVGPETKVLFGTRMRMPASQDLLQLFHTHLLETASAEAHELDPGLSGMERKHNMTIHIFEQQRESEE